MLGIEDNTMSNSFPHWVLEGNLGALIWTESLGGFFSFSSLLDRFCTSGVIFNRMHQVLCAFLLAWGGFGDMAVVGLRLINYGSWKVIIPHNFFFILQDLHFHLSSNCWLGRLGLYIICIHYDGCLQSVIFSCFKSAVIRYSWSWS